jgi:hypothetical protein
MPIVERDGISACVDESRRSWCGRQPLGELADRAIGTATRSVLAFHYVEAKAAQGRRDRMGRQQAGGQLRERAVGGVADHQCLTRGGGVKRRLQGQKNATEHGQQRGETCPGGHHGVVASHLRLPRARAK